VVALGHVVNFDVPGASEDYIHRVGRTGRAELTGEAFTFVAPEDESGLRAIERAIGKPLPRVLLPDFDYKQKPPEQAPEPRQQRPPQHARRPGQHPRHAPAHGRRPPEGRGQRHGQGRSEPEGAWAGRIQSDTRPQGYGARRPARSFRPRGSR
jgi:ATP-dependent RNA helicase RhlE